MAYAFHSIVAEDFSVEGASRRAADKANLFLKFAPGLPGQPMTQRTKELEICQMSTSMVRIQEKGLYEISLILYYEEETKEEQRREDRR